MGQFVSVNLLLITNAAMMLAWANVLMRLFAADWVAIYDDKQTACASHVGKSVTIALCVSFLELVNALFGVTKSKPHQVFLFSVVRLVVEIVVTPNLEKNCSAWQHIMTVVCWSVGDSVRFGCFFFDMIL